MDEPAVHQSIKIGSVFPELSYREREVVAMLIQGVSNKEVARRLHISPRTVEDYRGNVYQKTKLHTMAAVAYRVMGEPEVTA